ncbi:DNA-binding transcriptional activator GcvA [Hartmannibacter diazotrophicus]|uniref:DNA-binding transcriptional activator GcvA n=1 Tax=Hartmannibacter diazotrophicus TaxID=1482074 RepID=A0A2C9D9V4_9HYPH|nr:LysR family transcriptional regulator [Hartmannibacter diazotrophicus]SON57013.1 DNA-binding transcriptional activator GcvA [Hartmannibacter diazotrophicus]
MIADWSDLQTILAVATCGSLSAAARELGVNQSTVSRRLQAIERGLAQPAFVRGGDGRFVPTETGETLVATARTVKDLVLQAEEQLCFSTRPIRIATCEVLAGAFVAPALARWAAETGGLGDLAVHDDLFSLRPDQYDVLVTPGESAPPDLVGRKVAEFTWGFYASIDYLAEHPLVPGTRDLAGHSVIHPSGSLAEISAYDAIRALGGRVVFSSSSPIAQRDIAAKGGGIALLPTTLAAGRGDLVPLNLGPAPVSDVWILARRAAAQQPRLRGFLDWAYNQQRIPGTIGHSEGQPRAAGA